MSTVITSIIALGLFGGWIYFQQPSMIFYPVKEMIETPEDWGMVYENVRIQSQDGIELHGWYIPNTQSRRVLLFFHGNAGNISHRGDSIDIFHRVGLNIFIIDYRGYGQSKGKPDEKGLYEDARAAWRFLINTKSFSKENIIIFGRSLGGVVAAKLAAEMQPGYLILESTFSSARDMANKVFPVISRLVPLRFKLNAEEYIKEVDSPVLVAHGPDDEVIPYELGQKVYNAANRPKTFLEMRGGHNGGFLMSQPEYEKEIRKFLSLEAGQK